jgi:putative methionine-R-sulfoxide reductase with GAF domain/ribosomal protein S18 acetylase RimI-like enzyme
MLPNDLTLLLDKLLPRVEKAKLIAEAIRAAGTYRWVGLHDVDNERGLVSNIAWSGSGAPEYPVFPITKGLNSRAIAAKRTVNVGDVASDAAYLTALPTTQSEIIIPVLSATGDKVVRTIIAESERPDAFDAHTQTSLEECANALRPFWQHEKSSAAFTIRRATIDDSEGILECLASAFAAFRESYTPEGFLDTVLSAETVQQRLQDMDIFVAVRTDGTVIGTIACKVEHEGEGHLRGMAVKPEWQGSCLAADLLARAEEELRNAGCSTITLDTTQPLRRAVRFYEKHGYQPTGRVGDFFGMPLFEYRKYVENND